MSGVDRVTRPAQFDKRGQDTVEERAEFACLSSTESIKRHQETLLVVLLDLLAMEDLQRLTRGRNPRWHKPHLARQFSQLGGRWIWNVVNFKRLHFSALILVLLGLSRFGCGFVGAGS